MTPRRLAFELLERRQLLAAFAVPWPEPSDLKLSFVPDGTPAAELSSSLFQTLDRQPTSAWQEQILRAFQTWAVESNINVRLSPDGGQPLDTLGLKQGDPRFGDIRIGAVPLAPDVLAVADPYDPFVANTWVGDVLLNSAYLFDRGDTSGAYDLFSVLLHEAGHVFGVGHSSNPASPMFEDFQQVNGGLTAGDVAELRAIYGPRLADAFEGSTGNDSLDRATPLSLVDDAGEPSMTELDADLGRGDRDIYRVVLPANVTTLAVRMEASERSMLVSRVTVLDASGQIVATTVAQGPQDNDVTINLEGRTPGATYFVQIDPGRDDVFGVGGYRLEVDSLLDREAGYGALEESVPFPPDAERLMATTPGYVEHTYYEMYDTITRATQSHVYRVRSADLGPGMTNVMTVVVDWDSDAEYSVSIRDAAGHPLDAATVFDGVGHLALQIPSVESDRDYLVEVFGGGDEPLDPTDELAYEVTVDFDQDGEHLLPLVNNQLAPGQLEFRAPLEVSESQEFHFVLSASDWNAAAETGVRFTILDAQGRFVTTAVATDGASRGGNVFLNQGRYTLVFARDSEIADTQLLFQLNGLTQSSPLGPQLRDTAHAPIDRTAGLVREQLEFFWGSLSTARGETTAEGATAPHGAALPVVLTASVNAGWPAGPMHGEPGLSAEFELLAPQASGATAASLRGADPANVTRPVLPGTGGAVAMIALNEARFAPAEVADDAEASWARSAAPGEANDKSSTRDALESDDRAESGLTVTDYALLALQFSWFGLAWLLWPKRRRRDEFPSS